MWHQFLGWCLGKHPCLVRVYWKIRLCLSMLERRDHVSSALEYSEHVFWWCNYTTYRLHRYDYLVRTWFLLSFLKPQEFKNFCSRYSSWQWFSIVLQSPWVRIWLQEITCTCSHPSHYHAQYEYIASTVQKFIGACAISYSTFLNQILQDYVKLPVWMLGCGWCTRNQGSFDTRISSIP